MPRCLVKRKGEREREKKAAAGHRVAEGQLAASLRSQNRGGAGGTRNTFKVNPNVNTRCLDFTEDSSDVQSKFLISHVPCPPLPPKNGAKNSLLASLDRDSKQLDCFEWLHVCVCATLGLRECEQQKEG